LGLARNLLRHLARRAGRAVVESGLEPEVAIRGARSIGRVVTQVRADVQIDTIALAGYRLTQQVEVDAALAAFQAEIDTAGCRATDGPAAGEQQVVRGQLLAHN